MAAKKPATAKKATQKVVVRRKTATAKVAPKKAAPVKSAKAAPKKSTAVVKDAFNKTQLFTTISEEVGLSKKEVSGVYESLIGVIERHVKKTGVGEFTLPGLLKVRVVRKPATKPRKGINPFTGLETTFQAKPVRNVVKIKALKRLKDMVV